MKIRTDPTCSACGEEDETSLHFLGKCPATMMARHSIFGSHLLRSDELRCIQPHALMRFVRVSLWLFQGYALGQYRYGISAGWLIPTRPKGKVR